jgi:hypothetical protein
VVLTATFGINTNMPAKTYVKVAGAWQPVRVIAPRSGGSARLAKAVYVKDGGSWRLVYGGNTATENFTTPSTFNWTVPDGVHSITVTGCGGGGAGGSGDGGANNDGPGYGGGGSNLITQTYSVVPGTVLSVTVGAGGTGQGGTGGTARGGTAGRATTVTGTGVSFNAVGGGGGGSAPGWGTFGEVSPGVLDTQLRGGAGANGAGSGSRPDAGTSTNGGANGGAGGPYNQQAGANGGNGKLTISY